jgi:hypothetical protein
MSNFAEIILRSSLQLQSTKMSDNPEFLSENKTLLHRYFFYNFLVSAGLMDIFALSRTIGIYSDMHETIYNTLSHMTLQLSQRPLNDTLDEAIITDVLSENNSIGGAAAVELKVKDLQESGESACVTLIKMITTNMELVVTD